jgi:hypothetical protein
LRWWQFFRSIDVERDDGRVECDRVERYGWFEHYWRLHLRWLQRVRQLQWLWVR